MATTGEKVEGITSGILDPIIGDTTTTKKKTAPTQSGIGTGAVVGLSILGLGLIIGAIYLFK